MGKRKQTRGKLDTLREQGCLNRRAEGVVDELFEDSEFFDAHDLLQVKYELVRRVTIDRVPISVAANAFGVSRPTVYQAIASFQDAGLAGLLPNRPGPRRAHKLSEEVVAFIRKTLAKSPELRSADLVTTLWERFELEVHPRSIERALARDEKKTR